MVGYRSVKTNWNRLYRIIRLNNCGAQRRLSRVKVTDNSVKPCLAPELNTACALLFSSEPDTVQLFVNRIYVHQIKKVDSE